jgi:hypothetical protein
MRAMRIYEGGPRQDYEEALRSIGSFLDQRGMREVLMVETGDGFVVQGLAPRAADAKAWAEPTVGLEKETLTFLEEDVERFMEEAYAQRRRGPRARSTVPDTFYENALRVLGRYIDQQKPRDVFLFEQDRSFVLRLLMSARTGDRHVLAEFTRHELEQMIAGASELRARPGEAHQVA